jgi:hypothetical protein
MLELRVRDGELEPGGQWVYAWLADDGVVYVGATALHPETRTWLHLHHADAEVGRLRARFPALGETELVVLALPLPPDADRQRVRHGAVRQLETRGLLSARHVCDPTPEVEPPPEAGELLTAVARRYETA